MAIAEIERTHSSTYESFLTRHATVRALMQRRFALMQEAMDTIQETTLNDSLDETRSDPDKGVLADEFEQQPGHLKMLMNSLRTLFTTVPEDDDEKVTEYAFVTGLQILSQISYQTMMDGDLPKGYVTTDGIGGIVICWMGEGGSSVVLDIGSSETEPKRLYHRKIDATSSVTNQVNSDTLLSRLRNIKVAGTLEQQK